MRTDPPLGGIFRGPDEVLEFFGRLPKFFPGLQVSPEAYHEAGDTVLVRSPGCPRQQQPHRCQVDWGPLTLRPTAVRRGSAFSRGHGRLRLARVAGHPRRS